MDRQTILGEIVEQFQQLKTDLRFVGETKLITLIDVSFLQNNQRSSLGWSRWNFTLFQILEFIDPCYDSGFNPTDRDFGDAVSLNEALQDFSPEVLAALAESLCQLLMQSPDHEERNNERNRERSKYCIVGLTAPTVLLREDGGYEI